MQKVSNIGYDYHRYLNRAELEIQRVRATRRVQIPKLRNRFK